MIILKKKTGWKVYNDRRVPRDRREDHEQAELSDQLANLSPGEFPQFSVRGKGRRA